MANECREGTVDESDEVERVLPGRRALAGRVAEGETLVSGVHHIDRGYPRFEQALRALGADVPREPDDDWFD